MKLTGVVKHCNSVQKFIMIIYTVEVPSCATASRKRPPPISDRQSKTPKFPSQSLTVGTSSERPPPVSDRDHFLGLTLNDFLLFLTSCKRPFDAFSGLYFRCVYVTVLRIYKELN